MAVENDVAADPVMAAVAAHLAICSDCAARQSETRLVLGRLADAAEAVFDEETPSHRFARQRRRILSRIEGILGPHPARILRFPTIEPRGIRHPSSAYRWFAATAATGLLIGMALVHPGGVPLSEADGAPAIAGNRAPAPGPVPAPDTPPASQADEQFMRELEAALTASRVEPLAALDEMTPRLRAASTDVR